MTEKDAKAIDKLLQKIAKRERNWPTQGIVVKGGVIRIKDGKVYEAPS